MLDESSDLAHRERSLESVDRAAARGRVAHESEVLSERDRVARIILRSKCARTRFENGSGGMVGVHSLQRDAIERSALRKHRRLLAPRTAHGPSSFDGGAQSTSTEAATQRALGRRNDSGRCHAGLPVSRDTDADGR